MKVLTIKFTVVKEAGRNVLRFDHISDASGRLFEPNSGMEEGETISIEREFEGDALNWLVPAEPSTN